MNRLFKWPSLIKRARWLGVQRGSSATETLVLMALFSLVFVAAEPSLVGLVLAALNRRFDLFSQLIALP